MSISTQIAGIQTSRNTIRAKLVELGLATSGAKLDALAAAVEAIINRGAVKVEVKEGESYTIPQGYHDGTGTVAGVAGGGNYTLQVKTVTPTKQQQSVTSDEGYYGLSGVTIGAIPEAYQDVTSVTVTEGDVLVGKVFVDSEGNVITGTMPNVGKVTEVLTPSRSSYTIPKGSHDGTGVVYVDPEVKSVTPTKKSQSVAPSTGKVLSVVNIGAIPDEYQDVTEVDAEAGHVLSGKKIVDSEGNVVTGSMPNNGAVTATIDGLSTTSYTIPAGNHNGSGTVSLTDDIEKALAEI